MSNTTELQEEPFIEISEWPKALSQEAFHGLAGEFVDMWEPHTEADRAALLVQFLAFFGHAVGHSPFFAVGGDDHTTNIFVCLVGPTSFARKGQSYGCVTRAFEFVEFKDRNVFGDGKAIRTKSGLSTGEGLIHAVRDDREVINEKSGKSILIPGVADKRLLVYESEFSSLLKRMCREGNTLSEVLRQAWDNQRLGTMTKKEAETATSAHISLIAHVTAADLSQHMKDVESMNGFGNRFLFIASKRAKKLSNPGRPSREALAAFGSKIAQAVDFGQDVNQMQRTPEAEKLYDRMYNGELTQPRIGRLVESLSARCAPYIVRLSMIYALADLSRVVEVRHLQSAKVVWDFAERTAKFVFGNSVGDKNAERVLALLRDAKSKGMTTKEVNYKIGGQYKPTESLKLLLQGGLVSMTPEQRGNTKAQVWRA
jgi:hypothetical protein